MRGLSLVMLVLLSAPLLAAEKDTKEAQALAKLRTDKLDDVQKLQLARHDALTETQQLQFKFVESGNWDAKTLFNIIQVNRDIAQARIELFAAPADRIDALKDTLGEAKHLERTIQKRVEKG
ncbi:hypothetical protein BH11PLA2_BH11PLA2_19570 [soil metagenome]